MWAPRGTEEYHFFITNIAPAGPSRPIHVAPYPANATLMIELNNYCGNTELRVGFTAKLERGVFAWVAGYGVVHRRAKEINDTGGGNTSNFIPPDPSNLEAQRADGPFDFRHILTVSYVYQLPVGRGLRFLLYTHGAVNEILGGWEIYRDHSLQHRWRLFCGHQLQFRQRRLGGDEFPNYVQNLNRLLIPTTGPRDGSTRPTSQTPLDRGWQLGA